MDKLQNTGNRQQVKEYGKWTMYTVQNTGNRQQVKEYGKWTSYRIQEMNNIHCAEYRK